ncbi:hypothetical protein [Inhella gelatinilytica]|uniref:Uncharacterized protein n=1 Tax=Inhella gelatinilytica TaxID=2795030 RepID=A0A931IWW0_9BURK|nr:hypothetical protein [Inhella gelatinilytica]MBH9554317.1 hypothetical protein [Inhella gelatinilytica]
MTPARRPPYRLMGLLAVPLLLWTLGGPHRVDVEVVAKPWRREVEIERQVRERDSNWCAQIPAGAEVLERERRDDPSGIQPPADYCRYLAPVWRKRRSAIASGLAPQVPEWPLVALREASEAESAERPGKRHATQELSLRAVDGSEWTCRPAFEAWTRFTVGQKLSLQVDRWGVADCSSLRPL